MIIFTCDDIDDFTGKSLSLKLYLNSLVYHRNIFLESLRQSSEILGQLLKIYEVLGTCSGTFVWPTEQFWKIFGKWSEIFGKSSKMPSLVCLCNKKPEHYTLARRYELYVRVASLIAQLLNLITLIMILYN